MIETVYHIDEGSTQSDSGEVFSVAQSPHSTQKQAFHTCSEGAAPLQRIKFVCPGVMLLLSYDRQFPGCHI